MGSSRIKACDGFSLFILSYRILGLVPVSNRLLHSHDGLHTLVHVLGRKAADPYQAVPNLVLFESQLSLIGERLQLTSAALSVAGALGFCTKRRRLNYLLQPCISIILFDLYNPCLHPVSHNGVLYKQGEALCLAYSEALGSHIFNA